MPRVSTSMSPGWSGLAPGLRSPSTISAPAMPLATCIAVEPCRCGWYQKVPAGWSAGMLYSYWKLPPGGRSSRTLSLLPVGETQSPWACMLVLLKQPGPSCPPACPPPVAQAPASPGSSLRNVMRTVSPGRTRMVGATIGKAPILPVGRGATVSR